MKTERGGLLQQRAQVSAQPRCLFIALQLAEWLSAFVVLYSLFPEAVGFCVFVRFSVFLSFSVPFSSFSVYLFRSFQSIF